MFLRLWAFLTGYLVIELPATQGERFVNRCLRLGLALWDLKHGPKRRLRASLAVASFREIRPVARELGVRPVILARRGLPFAMLRLRRRRMLLVGAGLVGAALYAMSSFVWFIQVEGAERIPAGRVLEAAADLGLRPGAWRRALDADEIGRRLPLELPEISWAGVEIQGTKAVIEVAEKSLLDPAQAPDDRPANLVARRAGMILAMTVLSGVPVVEPGTVVQEGQLLVSGVLYGEANPAVAGSEEEERPAPAAYVRARGQVLARVWYEAEAEAPLTVTREVSTGRETTRRYLRWGDWSFRLSGRGEIPYRQYRKEVLLWLPPEWRGTTLPLSLMVVRYHEVVGRAERRSPEEALRSAEQEALEKALAGIPVTARLVSRETRVVSRSRHSIRVAVTVETEEDIAVTRLLPVGRGETGGQKGT